MCKNIAVWDCNLVKMTEKLSYFSISLHIILIYSLEHCPGSMNV